MRVASGRINPWPLFTALRLSWGGRAAAGADSHAVVAPVFATQKRRAMCDPAQGVGADSGQQTRRQLVLVAVCDRAGVRTCAGLYPASATRVGGRLRSHGGELTGSTEGNSAQVYLGDVGPEMA